MNHLKTDVGREFKDRDVVFTPDHIAAEIVKRFEPSGTVLDPCAGDGAFQKHIPGCFWCEIKNGRDFFDWKTPVDWIVGNPPFSILNEWLQHSFSVAKNVVYLLPVAKVFGSRKRLLMIAEYGGIAQIYVPWTGRDVGFDFGWACGAIHFKKNHGQNMILVV